MLTALSIRDVVLVDALDLDVETGLTVLTGETGAGKSIILDALGLALGGRGAGEGAVQPRAPIRSSHNLCPGVAKTASRPPQIVSASEAMGPRTSGGQFSSSQARVSVRKASRSVMSRVPRVSSLEGRLADGFRLATVICAQATAWPPARWWS